MTKGQVPSADCGQGAKEIWRWTEEMDFVMLTAFAEEHLRGNRVNGSWLPEVYAHVVTALKDVVVADVTKQHIKSRMKTSQEKVY
ncbi:Myb/SANT-like domain [Sesbania bispinosa]|nr:Myb/SANT-like domain [Sesbania bispinosa]